MAPNGRLHIFALLRRGKQTRRSVDRALVNYGRPRGDLELIQQPE